MKYSDSPSPKLRNTVNPYLQGVGIIFNRLKWDLFPAAWNSRNKLKNIHNKHYGEKAVILCNGPSLLKTDLSLLSNVYTFGLNKINLIFSKTNYRPSCIVAINQHVIIQNSEFYDSTDIPIYVDSFAHKFIKQRHNVTFLHSCKHSTSKFAKDCSLSINQGGTVTFAALQLAYHMGFTKVALVGCDHNFKAKGSPNKLVKAGDQDVDHFDPNYFSGEMKWQLPDLPLSEYSYNLAKYAYQENDREIINATDGGKLEIFRRQSLESFLI